MTQAKRLPSGRDLSAAAGMARALRRAIRRSRDRDIGVRADDSQRQHGAYPRRSRRSRIRAAASRKADGPARRSRRADDARRASHRRHQSLPHDAAAIHRKADRAGKTFADQAVIAIENARLFERAARNASSRDSTADRDGGSAQGHRQLADERCSRCSTRSRKARRVCVRRAIGVDPRVVGDEIQPGAR